MPLEIDMLFVKKADAIIVRTFDDIREHVIVIDAGNTADGETVVNHIEKWTEKGEIDLLISTHPHSDHIGGIVNVLKNITVHEVLIHDLRTFSKQIKTFRGIATQEQMQRAMKSLDQLEEVINTIDESRIPRKQPFTGVSYTLSDDADLIIVGPSEDFYTNLAPRIKSKLARETLNTDAAIVDENDDQCPFNNSSVITFIRYKECNYLFTADAGPAALQDALQNMEPELSNIYWMQVPHHGSRRSITADLIKEFSPSTAFVSAPGEDGIHPNPAVIRLFQNEGCNVYGTYKDGNLHHSNGDVSPRDGYIPATPLDENAE